MSAPAKARSKASRRRATGKVPWLALPGSQGLWTALIALVAIALYLPAIGFELVYDSKAQILIDEFIHQPRHWADVLTLRVMGMDVLDFNRPVNLFTLMVDSALWGKTTPGYHLTSILLHGATAALLFRWLLALTGRLAPAVLAALVFAVHPLSCEAVVEVGNREDLLAVFFLLAGLLSATAFQPAATARTPRSFWLPAAGTIVFLFLSMASKETGVAGPVALAAYAWTMRRNEPRRPWLGLVLATAIPTGVFLIVRFALAPAHSIIFTDPPARIAQNWPELILTQCRIFSAEFLRIVWPADLCADYNGYTLRNIGAAAGVLTVLAVITVQLLASLRGANRSLFALASVLFWASLLPVANLVPIYRPMADRFLYMPLAAVALGIAAALSYRKSGSASPLPNAIDPGVLSIASVVVVALAAAAWSQEQAWQDESALWAQTVERNPFSYNGWLGCGGAALERHEPAEAAKAFIHASRLAKESRPEAFAGLALAADAMGRQADAAAMLNKAVALDPRYARPDSLVDAVMLEPVYAQRLKLIAVRAARSAQGRR